MFAQIYSRLSWVPFEAHDFAGFYCLILPVAAVVVWHSPEVLRQRRQKARPDPSSGAHLALGYGISKLSPELHTPATAGASYCLPGR